MEGSRNAPATAATTPERRAMKASGSGLEEVSPVFLPASPPQVTVEALGAVHGDREKGVRGERERAMLPVVLTASEMESLPFELKVSVASLLAYGDLVALRACSAELKAVAEHVLGNQSEKFFCCMACSAVIARPVEVYPMERRVGFEIAGAGDDSVNGIYEPGIVPHYYGPPAWRKRGSSLFMFRWARTQWCLARLALDEPLDGNVTDDWFLSNRVYVAPSGNPPCDEPPCRGWVPMRGAAPAPRCSEAFVPVLHQELPAEEVGTSLPMLPAPHAVAPLCPVANVEFEDSDLALCVPRNCGRAAVRVREEVTLDQRIQSRDRQLQTPRSFRIRPAHCPGCDLFLGVCIVSFSEPQGTTRVIGRSHGREVDIGDTDEEWLAYQHALQTTYQLKTHLQTQAADMKSDSVAVHCPRMEADVDVDGCADADEEQQDEQAHPGGMQGTQDSCIPTGMCEGGGTVVNQLYLGKSYLCLMKEAAQAPGTARQVSCPLVAPVSCDGAGDLSSDVRLLSSTRRLVPVTRTEDLVCRTHGCANVLCTISQVLSTEHAWSLDPQPHGSSTRRMRGAESACYVNSLRSGSFGLSNERLESLAQGPMTVADVSCAQCHRTVGWKFVRSGANAPRRSRRRVGALVGGSDDGAAPTPSPPESTRTGIWALMRRGRRGSGGDIAGVVDDGDDALSSDEDEGQHRGLHLPVPLPFLSLTGRYGGSAPRGLLGRRNRNQEGRFGLVDSRIRLASQPDSPESDDEDAEEDEFALDESSSDNDESSSDNDDGQQQHEEQQGGDEAAEAPQLPAVAFGGTLSPPALNDDEQPGRCRPS